MPLTDLPLEQLHQYAGRNPRPADFDAFWDDALQELNEVESRFEASAASFQVPDFSCQDITFQGVGGAHLHARFARPLQTADACPLLVMHHGYAWKAAEWFTLLSWCAAGFAVLAPDVRGQGGRSDDPGGQPGNTLRGHIVRGLTGEPKDLFYRGAFLDTAQAVRVGAQLEGVDPDRIGTFGASQGGGLALACAALSPHVKAVASIYPFLCDYKRVWEMDQAKDAYEELRLHFRIQDPLHRSEDAVFERLGYIDCQHLAPRVSCPTLLVTGLMDTICPPSTQFAAFNKLRSEKEVIVYPDFGHEGLPDVQEHLWTFFRKTL